MAPPKRGATGASGGGEPKKKAKALPNPTSPELQSDGYTVMPSECMYRMHPGYDGNGKKKIAAFDLDGTLIFRDNVPKPKGKDVEGPEFQFINSNVPSVLKKYHEDGYGIVVFSNQGTIRKAMLGAASETIRRITVSMLERLSPDGNAANSIPIHIVIATSDSKAGSAYRKPQTKMWEHFVKEMNCGVDPDLSASFYVGDAAGRPTDINGGSDSDKKFAEGIGIEFKLPEDVFGRVGRDENDGMEKAFRELAEVFEQSDDENKIWKVRSAKKVADIIARFEDVITSSKQLNNIQGIGPKTLLKVDEYLATGKLAEIDAIKPEIPTEKKKVIASKDEIGQKFL